MSELAQPAVMAKRARAWPKTAGGAGTLLLFLIFGAIVCSWSVVGGIVIIGASVALFALTGRIWICGNCHSPLPDARATICPACKAELS